MILFIKKRYFILITCAIALSLIGICIHIEANRAFFTVAPIGLNKTIVLDAGHGEPDGGAVGSSDISEATINLDVALFLQKYLEQSNINVIMTRSDANGIYDEGLESIRKKKVSDMHNREEIMNSSDADAFISIHMNKFTDSKYSGPQVFYSHVTAESEALAECIQQELIYELNPVKQREIKKADNSIYLLKNAKIPAVLVECGFLSNPAEEKLLISDDYKKKIAWAIYKGIISYF